MGEIRSVIFLSIGVLVGWSAARYQGGLPKVSISTTTAAAAESLESALSGTCSIPPVGKTVEKSAAPVLVQPVASPTLLEQMSQLKMSELYKNCEAAEVKFLENKMAGFGKTLYELPANEKDREVTEWLRRFGEITATSSYWKSTFALELGGDVIQIDLLMDLKGSSDENYKCAAWTAYYEINGKPNVDSYFSQSSCDGGGFRKKGDHYYFDLNLYAFSGIGKHITILLLPMPAGGGAEYLAAEAEKWSSIPQFSWQRSSIFEFSQLQQKFQQKSAMIGEE